MSWVRFSNEEEWLQELARDVELVNRRIVRICAHSTQAEGALGGALTRVSLVAGYEVGGQVVRLERYCGSFMGPADLPTPGDGADVYERLRAKLTADVQALGLDVRGGAFQPQESAR